MKCVPYWMQFSTVKTKLSRRRSSFKLNMGSTEINGISGMLKIRHLFKWCGTSKPLCNTASPWGLLFPLPLIITQQCTANKQLFYTSSIIKHILVEATGQGLGDAHQDSAHRKENLALGAPPCTSYLLMLLKDLTSSMTPSALLQSSVASPYWFLFIASIISLATAVTSARPWSSRRD